MLLSNSNLDNRCMYCTLSDDADSNGIGWLRCSGQMFLMFTGLNKIGIFQMIVYSTATESFAGGTISDAQENLPINCNTHTTYYCFCMLSILRICRNRRSKGISICWNLSALIAVHAELFCSYFQYTFTVYTLTYHVHIPTIHLYT
jgi:hypothetical protein